MDSRRELLIAYNDYVYQNNLGLSKEHIDSFLSSLPPQGSESKDKAFEKRWTDFDMAGFAGYYSGRIQTDRSLTFKQILKEFEDDKAKTGKRIASLPSPPVGDNK